MVLDVWYEYGTLKQTSIFIFRQGLTFGRKISIK